MNHAGLSVAVLPEKGELLMIRKTLSFTSLALVMLSFTALTIRADESLSNKAQDKMGDAKTDMKKSTRKMKRHARKHTNNNNIGKDAKDKMNDAGDDISNTADKAKRKVE